MNKMNLPPPFGPVRKRPSYPSSGSQKEMPVRKDELKYYGKRCIPEKEVEEEEEEDDNNNNFNEKRQEVDNNPFCKTTPVTMSFNKNTSTTTDASSHPPIKFVNSDKQKLESVFSTPMALRSCISRQDILKHRISKEEMTQHKCFDNYVCGDPNKKLFIRNLSKDVTEEDLCNIFGCFFDSDEIVKQ